MALLGTTPSQSAHNWTTAYAAEIKKVSPMLYSPLKIMMPTLRILWANKKPANEGQGWGPREKAYFNIEHAVYSPHKGNRNQVYTFDDLDPITQSEWSPVKWWNAAGTNEYEIADYGNSNMSLLNLAEQKMRAIHLGNTLYWNYAIWSNHEETLTGDYLDIESVLSTAGQRIPFPVKFKDLSATSEMIYSIPMLCRKTTTGHTLGNIATGTTGATANLFWQPLVTVGGSITQNSTSGADNIDVCTDDNLTTVPLTMDAINTHLRQMQVGNMYKIYAACPGTLYQFLVNTILAEQRRMADEYLKADLGINMNITMEEYNCVFYYEPMLDYLWPGTIWFFDPECLFLCYDPVFDPKVRAWEEIPGTNMSGTVVSYRHQLVRPDAQGVSAMHAYTDES